MVAFGYFRVVLVKVFFALPISTNIMKPRKKLPKLPTVERLSTLIGEAVKRSNNHLFYRLIFIARIRPRVLLL